MIRTGRLPVSILMCAFVLVFAPAPAHSQTSVTVGYQALHLPDNWVSAGVNFDVARDISRRWDVVGEFGLAHDNGAKGTSGFNIFNIDGGVRWSPRRSGPAAFAQLLAGMQISTASIDTDYVFILQPGVGFHAPIGDRWGLSAQVDYCPSFYREELVNEVRVVIGARWIGN